MPLIRTLLMAAAKRVAADPELRAKASGVARDHVIPAARDTARKTGDAMRNAQRTVSEEVDRAMRDAPPEATRAEIAGRVTRRLLDRTRGDG